MDDKTIDLWLEPETQVSAREFSIRVDGVKPEQATAIQRRVTDALQHRWDVTAERLWAQPDTSLDTSAECGPIRVGLMGLMADPARERELQDVVRTVVSDELGSDEAAAAACICASGVPGVVRINMNILWFNGGVWTPPPSGKSYWDIAINLSSLLLGTNWVLMTVRDGATFNPPIPKNEALIGLTNNSFPLGPKEIWAFNLCRGRTGISVYQGWLSSTPVRMRLYPAVCRDETDTIVLRKNGPFGIGVDVGHFAPEIFWPAFGGTWTDIDWRLG